MRGRIELLKCGLTCFGIKSHPFAGTFRSEHVLITTMEVINEYPGHKISALSFIETPLQESIIVTGTSDQLYSNRVQVWLKQDSDLQLLHEDAFDGDVHSISYIQDSMLAMTSSKGSLIVYHLNNHRLDQVSEAKVCKGPANGVMFNERSKDIITVGEDGSIGLINLSKLSDKPSRTQVSMSALTCIESCSDKAVLVGNTAGHIKVVDLRTGKTEMSLPNNLNSVSVIRRNPGSHHFVMTGHQNGIIALWDLRSAKDASPFEMSTHEGSVTGMQFIEGDNVMMTSSLDGHLLKWTLENTSTASSVDPLIRPISRSGPAINCFHYHRCSNTNEVAFANDREVLCVMTY